MRESRLIYAKRNMLTGIITKMLQLTIPFATRTVIIYCLGALYLGLNSLYGSLLTVLSLAEMGVGAAMVFSMYAPLAKDDYNTVCALLNLYRKIYRIIGFVVMSIGCLSMIFLPYLIKGEVPNDINIYILFFVFLLNTSLSYFLFAYKESLLIANQRSDVLNNINSAITLTSGLLQIIILLVFKNYYLFCIVLPISTVLRNLTINHYVRKMYPNIICEGEISNSELTDIKKRVSGLLIYKICYVFRDSFSAIIVSSFLGLTELAIYNNYVYITSAITGFMIIIKNSITAGIGNSIAIESEDKNYGDFNKCMMLYMWIALLATSCLYGTIQPFIKVWVGNEYLLNVNIVLLVCAHFYCDKLGDICAVYRQAAGLWWHDRYRPIVEAITSLMLSIYLVRLYGIAGVIIGPVFCLVFINSIWASWILFRHYFVSKNLISYIKRVVYYIAVLIINIFIIHIIYSKTASFIGNGFVLITLNLFSSSLIGLSVGLVFFRYLPEYNNAVILLKNICKNKKHE